MPSLADFPRPPLATYRAGPSYSIPEQAVFRLESGDVDRAVRILSDGVRYHQGVADALAEYLRQLERYLVESAPVAPPPF